MPAVVLERARWGKILYSLASIGQGQNAQHQRGSRDFSQNGIGAQGHADRRKGLTSAGGIFIDLLVRQGLHDYRAIQEQPRRLRLVVSPSTAYDQRREPMITPK